MRIAARSGAGSSFAVRAAPLPVPKCGRILATKWADLGSRREGTLERQCCMVGVEVSWFCQPDRRRSEAVSLRDTWQEGRQTIGVWHRLGNIEAAEVLAGAELDWVCIDAQHAFIDISTTRMMLRGLAALNCPGIVRIPWHDPGIAMTALDAGAAGILVPVVDDADQLDKMIKACRYPPRGYRSYAGLGLGGTDSSRANHRVACGAMIETAAAIENLDAILKVEGLDFVFIGPHDLALSLGCSLSDPLGHAPVTRAIAKVHEASEAHAVALGVYCSGVEMMARLELSRYQLLAISSDLSLLAVAIKDAAAVARSALEAQRIE